MKKETILVVGASANCEKYGFVIMDNLLKRGFDTIPINPKEEKILCVKAFKTITEYVKANPEKKIDWVDFVLPPAVAYKILPEIKSLKIKRVWFQPGSESDIAIEYCKKNNIRCVHHACIMANYE